MMIIIDIPSDEVLAIFVPIAAYWVYSGFCEIAGSLLDGGGGGGGGAYRLHSRSEETTRNSVPKCRVAATVLLQQIVQAAVAFLVFKVTRERDGAATFSADLRPPASAAAAVAVALQFLVAMATMDTWQYFWHRYMHTNRFLYRHVHAWHHRLVVPYSFGAQYNHPLEGFLLDTVGGAVSFSVSGMSPRTAIFFFSLAAVKGVDDHCGLRLPVNVFHVIFRNNTIYHDVHHQMYGAKYNFSQPFFVFWDKIMGTHMPYEMVHRKRWWGPASSAGKEDVN